MKYAWERWGHIATVILAALTLLTAALALGAWSSDKADAEDVMNHETRIQLLERGSHRAQVWRDKADVKLDSLLARSERR